MTSNETDPAKWPMERRHAYIADATPLERAAMLHYLGGWTHDGFAGAVAEVERERAFEAALPLSSVPGFPAGKHVRVVRSGMGGSL